VKPLHDLHAVPPDEVLGSSMQILDLSMWGHVADAEALVAGVAACIGMTRLGPAISWTNPDQSGRGGWGVTTLLRIAESHIIIETFSTVLTAYLSVRSCKPFSPSHVIDYANGSGLIVCDHVGKIMRASKNG